MSNVEQSLKNLPLKGIQHIEASCQTLPLEQKYIKSGDVVLSSKDVWEQKYTGANVRLNDVRDICLKDIELELKFLVNRYSAWLDEKLYLNFKRNDCNLYQHVLASKRGNIVYQKRMIERVIRGVTFLESIESKKLFVRKDSTKHKRKRYVSNAFLITLNHAPAKEGFKHVQVINELRRKKRKVGYPVVFRRGPLINDRSINLKLDGVQTGLFNAMMDGYVTEVVRHKRPVDMSNKKDSWDSLYYRSNKFLARLRKKYGKMWVLKAFESHESGFPHIHYLVIFLSPQEVFLKPVTRGKDAGKTKWRMLWEESKSVKKMWTSGSADVLGVRNYKSVLNYLNKDMMKASFGYKNYDVSQKNKNVLTLSLLWLFRKQGNTISRTGLRCEFIEQFATSKPYFVVSTIKYVSNWEFCGFGTYQFAEGVQPPPVFKTIGVIE